MSAGRICVREVDVISPEESAQVAAARMHDRKVGTLVVIDEQRMPVGIVTDRDLVVRVLAPGRDITQTTVAEVMSAAPGTVFEQTPIEDALRLMRAGPFRRVPVVDQGGRLAGLLSLDDILDLLAEEFRDIGQLLQAEQPRTLGKLLSES
jgi:CBS domain-containing protein